MTENDPEDFLPFAETKAGKAAAAARRAEEVAYRAAKRLADAEFDRNS